MKTRRHNWTLAFVMFSGIVFAQQPPVKVKNFNASESYDPPHQAQMKFLLQGAEAEPLTAGRYLVKELKLQTFLQDGKRELLVEAPQCVYDAQAHSASSPGRLRVQSGDGKLSIEGEGFLWRQTNSSLFISNQVHT